MSEWMIYGANGYTGRLIAQRARQQGLSPILAGRNAAAIGKIADETGLPYRVFALDQAQGVREGIEGCSLVLHCAGPFSSTSAPMIEACLANRSHYLDITGEISVFQHAWRQSERARKADVVLCPGAGFDVVPTDCMAARLVAALPAATSLRLAFRAAGGLSPGTAKTSVEGLSQGGCVRKDGQLQRVPLAWKTCRVPFADGEAEAVTIPWGDVFTAWVSTGVGDIEVYLAVPPHALRRLRRMRWIRPLLALGPAQRLLKRRIDQKVRGPDAQARERGGTQLWGRAESADGRSVTAVMQTPNGYELTVTASLALVQYLLEGGAAEGGYYTPSLLAGAGFAESLPGVRLDLPAA